MANASINDIYLFLGKHTDWEKVADQNYGDKNDICEENEFVSFVNKEWDGENSLTDDLVTKFWNGINKGKTETELSSGVKELSMNELNATKYEATKRVIIEDYKGRVNNMCPNWLKKVSITSGDVSGSVSGYDEKWIQNINTNISDIAGSVSASQYSNIDDYEQAIKDELEAHLAAMLTNETARQTTAAFEAALKKLGIEEMSSNDSSIKELTNTTLTNINNKIKSNGGITSAIFNDILNILNTLCSKIVKILQTENKENIENVGKTPETEDEPSSDISYDFNGADKFSSTVGTEVTQSGYYVIGTDKQPLESVVYSIESNESGINLITQDKGVAIKYNIENEGTYTATITATKDGVQIAKKVVKITITAQKTENEKTIQNRQSVEDSSVLKNTETGDDRKITSDDEYKDVFESKLNCTSPEEAKRRVKSELKYYIAKLTDELCNENGNYNYSAISYAQTTTYNYFAAQIDATEFKESDYYVFNTNTYQYSQDNITYTDADGNKQSIDSMSYQMVSAWNNSGSDFGKGFDGNSVENALDNSSSGIVLTCLLDEITTGSSSPVFNILIDKYNVKDKFKEFYNSYNIQDTNTSDDGVKLESQQDKLNNDLKNSYNALNEYCNGESLDINTLKSYISDIYNNAGIMVYQGTALITSLDNLTDVAALISSGGASSVLKYTVYTSDGAIIGDIKIKYSNESEKNKILDIF